MVISYSQYRKDDVNTPVGVGIIKLSKNFKGQNKRLDVNCTDYRGLSFRVKYQMMLGSGFVCFPCGEILGKSQLGMNLRR